MADFWDFLIVAVVFWFILRIIEMRAYGTKGWRMEKRLARRGKESHYDFDEKFGFVVGGLVCLFMGAALYWSQNIVQVPYVSSFIVLGGIVLAAIGGALLISAVVLAMLMMASGKR